MKEVIYSWEHTSGHTEHAGDQSCEQSGGASRLNEQKTD